MISLRDTKVRWFTAVALALLFLDLATKDWILGALSYRDGFNVVPGFFDIVHARNRGAAFGLLHGASPDLVRPLFLVVGAAAVGFLIWMLRDQPTGARILPAALGAIAGGAAGNMIDRARFGYVVDFLLVYVRDWHWPAFNVADIGITVGVVVLLLGEWRGRPPTAPPPD